MRKRERARGIERERERERKKDRERLRYIFEEICILQMASPSDIIYAPWLLNQIPKTRGAAWEVFRLETCFFGGTCILIRIQVPSKKQASNQ